MLEINTIRNDRQKIIDGLIKRNWTETSIVDQVLTVDDSRKAIQTELDKVNAEINTISKLIGQLYAQGKKEEAEVKKSDVGQLKERSKALEEEQRNIKSKLEELLLEIPNIPNEKVPPGKEDSDNLVFKDWTGQMPSLPNNALPHWELAEKYDLFDLKLGAKITGSGFPLFRGKGAQLKRALINFFLDEGRAAGYEEFMPPLIVNEASARGTGQLPDKEGQMYHITEENFFLIPTAEVPITNVHRDAKLSLDDLPIKMTGHTPCFRREAGSYGADVKGLNRVHQFDKVEIVQITHPDKSYDTLMEMLDHVGGLLEKLELPYRILCLCGGDIGFTSALTYDFEVYSAAQQKWLEVSSVSNFESFQANRLNLKYKDEDGKLKLAHTLNGSALALARIVASILENNQTEDGIVIPNVLQNYINFSIIN